LIVKNASVGFEDDVINDPDIWDCLTCNTCAERCRSDVAFADFVRVLRSEAVKVDNLGVCSHGGALQGMMRLSASPQLKPNRLDWLKDDVKNELKTSSDSDILLFTGCMPIFPTIFDDIGVDSRDILKASIKLMNLAEIKPQLTNEERCCGHDMIWTGEIETFKKLVQLNFNTFKKLKIKTIITACPEGYLTLKNDYPEYLKSTSDEDEDEENGWDFEVLHITEYLAKLVNDGVLKFPEDNPFNGSIVTYHDSCRLGRFMGVFDAPRTLLNAIPGLKLIEMEHNRERSQCCGVSNWTNCTNTSRSIRAERLQEAKDTGAQRLITSCPKCQIHLNCYTTNEFVKPQIKIDIEDIMVFLAKAAKVM
jgi:Fe-S oxidoreductase